MNLDRGMLSPYFATNSEERVCEFADPYILITSKKISKIDSIIKLLERVSKSGKPLFIIADDVEGEALSTMIISRLRGIIKVCAIKCPGFGNHHTEMLEDIAVITGGQVVIDESDSLEELEIYSEMLGSAKQVIITKDSTQIVSGYGQIDEVMNRLRLIKNQIADATSEYDKERLEKRLTNLSRSMSELKG